METSNGTPAEPTPADLAVGQVVQLYDADGWLRRWIVVQGQTADGLVWIGLRPL